VAEMGVPDVAVGYYAAFPGTPLFNSLFDAGKITFDAKYFAHILQCTALWPGISHNDHISKWELAKWKIRLYLTFYGAKDNGGILAIFSVLGRAIWEIISGNHKSRMPVAFKNGLRNGWGIIKLRLTKAPWMPRSEEQAMFASWDKIYRDLRRQVIDMGAAIPSPEDTTELHKSNVIKILRVNHETERTINLKKVS
jgi:hypothetical protein